MTVAERCSPHPVVERLAVVGDGLGRPLEVSSALIELTPLQSAESARERQERLLYDLFAHASDLAVVVDVEGTVLFAAPNDRNVLECPPQELLGRPIGRFLHPDDAEEAGAAFAAVVRDGGTRTITVRAAVRSRWRWVQVVLTNRCGASVGGIVLNISDVHERVEAERALRRAALHDDLTDLPNRAGIAHALGRLDAAGRPLAVFFIDLDHFKLVNESLGHHAGDRVLAAVSRRLRTTSAAGDVVGRFGGDEFVVVTGDVGPGAPEALADRLVEAVAEPLDLDGIPYRPSASIGLALPMPGAGGLDLLRYADMASYVLKRTRRGGVRTYDPSMRDAAEERFRLAAQLRRAIEADDVDVLFQPIVDLRTGRLLGAEALARWSDHERGPVGPATFVPLAEQMGFAPHLDRAVIRRALREVQALRAAGSLPPDAYVSVNLSARSITSADVADDLRSAAEDVGLPAGNVMVEITETSAMRDAPGAIGLLGALRRHGFRVALDDFGTGHSSLAYLRDLPISTLKVDRTFTGALGAEHGPSIAGWIIGLAEALGLGVIAEGVEDEAQAERLRRLGCTAAQGWLYAKALTAAELGAFARRAA